MNCNECLAALETESLREMTPGSPVMQHCATCPDCARLTTMLRDKEYETATVLNSLPPMSNPLSVAETAIITAQRRRLGRVAVMISGAALVATLWIVGATIVVPALNEGDIRRGSTLRTETITLSCLSPQQAGDIINPYVRSPRSRYFTPTSGISAITVTATREELARARNLIYEFEQDPSAACRLPMTIIQNLQKQMSEGQGTSPNPNPNPDKAATSLLGKPSGSLLDPKPPRGSGPVVPPDRASTAPKKQ